MKHLSSLFERYQKVLKPPQASVEKRVAELICEMTPIQVAPEQVSYTVTSRTITLQIPSVLKSELQHHKTNLLSCLQKEMGVNHAPKTIL